MTTEVEVVSLYVMINHIILQFLCYLSMNLSKIKYL